MAGDDFTGWHRIGGHRLQFYATDDEITEWLQETLPGPFAPYSAIGHEWRDGSWRASEYPLEEIRSAVEHHERRTLWIRSEVLSPGLISDDTECLSFSGLIAVDLGSERDGRLDDASLSIVDRIRHETGRERAQSEYLRIFERLRRSMRKRLVVKTERTFPDGSVSESWPMTARAADANVRGDVTFQARPAGLRS